MKKYEYRCEKCMIIEKRLVHSNGKPLNFIYCFKCGGEALRFPRPKSHENVYRKKSI